MSRPCALPDHAVMSFRQIGEELGVTPQGAAGIYHRAVKKLRSQCPNALEYMRLLARGAESFRLESKGAQ